MCHVTFFSRSSRRAGKEREWGVSDRASEGASGRLDVLMIDSMAPGEAFAQPQAWKHLQVERIQMR